MIHSQGQYSRGAYSEGMCEAFWQNFESCFTKKPGLSGDDFCSYLADFSQLSLTEADSCNGGITEGKVHLALKRVGSSKSPGLDGLPYKLYLRVSHIFVPILTVFNNWF